MLALLLLFCSHNLALRAGDICPQDSNHEQTSDPTPTVDPKLFNKRRYRSPRVLFSEHPPDSEPGEHNGSKDRTKRRAGQPQSRGVYSVCESVSFWVGNKTKATDISGNEITGSVVFAVGLWLRLDPSSVSLFQKEGAPATFFYVTYIIIGIGGIMMIVGFFGCCGAVKESKCLLALFFSSLLIILGAEVAAGIFGYLKKDEIIQEVQHFYTENSNTTMTMCCDGSEGIPDDTSLCPVGKKDCSKVIQEFFSEKLFIIACTGLGIAAIL
ncbi:beta-nerve growth factor, partial [Clarias magur]